MSTYKGLFFWETAGDCVRKNNEEPVTLTSELSSKKYDINVIHIQLLYNSICIYFIDISVRHAK